MRSTVGHGAHKPHHLTQPTRDWADVAASELEAALKGKQTPTHNHNMIAAALRKAFMRGQVSAQKQQAAANV